MQTLVANPADAINRLDALAKSVAVPRREAERCQRLAEALRRPVRVCLLGPAHHELSAVVKLAIGEPGAAGPDLPPATELVFGDRVRVTATLEDGSVLRQEGWPASDLVRQDPVFLQITAPFPPLRVMSILVLKLDSDPAMHRPALSWAARRSDIAVWCTPAFSATDAEIWGRAPERLTQHAYLLRTQPDPAARPRPGFEDFTDCLDLPIGGSSGNADGLRPLLDRLTADIEEARNADVDSAQLLLHRLGHLDTGDVAGSPDAAPDAGPSPLRPHLSEPLLFLKRRARQIAEDLSWTDNEADDWPQQVLEHCLETVEGLRERADGWPDDVPGLADLSRLFEEVCDVTLLLQLEAGAEQAQDGAAILFQLRCRLEGALSQPCGVPA